MILHSSSSNIAKKVWTLARTLANPSALPTILHSKGRITYWGGPQNGSPKPDRFASSKVGVCPCCFPVSAAAAREDEFVILHFVSLA